MSSVRVDVYSQALLRNGAAALAYIASLRCVRMIAPARLRDGNKSGRGQRYERPILDIREAHNTMVQSEIGSFVGSVVCCGPS